MFNLLRYFSLTSAAVILVIALAMHAAYRQIAVDDLVRMAERHNVALAQSFANTLWSRYSSYVTSVSRADGDTLRAHPETRNIHESLKTLTTELPVLKVKIYNVNGLTVYSSQPSQMGADKSENQGFLGAALTGTPTSKLSHRDSFSAFSSIVYDRSLVETYIPIRGVGGRIEGVFELYTDVTPLVAKIEANSTLFFVSLLFAFGLLYAILFLIIRRADLILKKQYVDLHSNEERIKAKNVALEHEVAERMRVGEALRASHDMLEQRVRERTVALEREITDRKHVEETLRGSRDQLQLITDNLPVLITYMDSECRFRFANKAARTWYALPPVKILGRSVEEILGESAYAKLEPRIATALSGASITFAETLVYPDRTPRDVEISYIPEVSETGKVQGFFGLVQDITERKKAQEALLASEHTLQERVADLEEAHRKLVWQGESLTRLADDLLVARDEARAGDRAKSEFLAAMSHELRTPLNAVIGFSEIIKDETFGPVGSTRYRDYAVDIHDSGQHLLNLINDILDLSKSESGTDELHEDEIEIPKIVRSALKLVGHRAEQGGVKLEIELADRLPALRADERKLKQILVNLLSNAVKFTDTGGEVTLRAWCRMDSGYVFQIVDTGIGIAPEDIPKALARFGQVDGDLDRQYEGTGLGLPLTKALVELHGGVLDLQSQVGVGTTVTVRFPPERTVASLDNSDFLDLEDGAAS